MFECDNCGELAYTEHVCAQCCGLGCSHCISEDGLCGPCVSHNAEIELMKSDDPWGDDENIDEDAEELF